MPKGIMGSGRSPFLDRSSWCFSVSEGEIIKARVNMNLSDILRGFKKGLQKIRTPPDRGLFWCPPTNL